MWIVKQKYSPCRLQCCFFYMCRLNNVCDNINHRDDVFASSSREASNSILYIFFVFATRVHHMSIASEDTTLGNKRTMDMNSP